MQVTIKNRKFDFDINSIDDKWQTQNGIFAFPISIGGTDCFLKKIENNHLSTDFLKKIKGKEVNFIPTIFDIQTTEKKEVVVFQSFNPGDLLEKQLKNKDFRKNLKLENIAKHLYVAITQINSLGYWHNDICTHNILCDNNNNNVLLDLDSCIPVSVRVSGNMVNQNLLGIFRNFFINYYDKDVLQESSFTGVHYNSLQVASQITFLAYLIQNPNVKYNSALESNSDLIAEFLYTRNQKVSDVFFKGVKTPLDLDDYKVLMEYLPFVADSLPKAKTPKIIEFKVSPSTIKFGGSCILSWNVENVNSISIEGIGENLSTSGSISLNLEKSRDFVLKYDFKKQTIKKEIKIIVEELVLKTPIINLFNVNGLNGEKITIVKDEFCLIKWEVENACKVLFKGSFYKAKDSVSHSFSKNEVLEITAINEQGKLENKKVFSKNIITVLPQLQNPKINKFEVNNSKNTVFTFNEGQSYDVSWNVSYASKVLINGAEFKTSGITTRVLRKNEVLQLEAINQRGLEVAKTKSAPVVLTVRKKVVQPPKPIPEILDFKISQNDDSNFLSKPVPLKNNVYQTNSNGKYNLEVNVSNTKEIFIKYGANGLYKKFFVEENVGILLNLNNDILEKHKEIYLKVNYVDTWEKSIEGIIKIDYTKIIQKPCVQKFAIAQNEKEWNFVGLNNISGNFLTAENNTTVKVKWETANSDKTILCLPDVFSEEVGKSGSKEIVLNNTTKEKAWKELTLTVINKDGRITESIRFEIEKKKKPVWLYIFAFLAIVLLIYIGDLYLIGFVFLAILFYMMIRAIVNYSKSKRKDKK